VVEKADATDVGGYGIRNWSLCDVFSSAEWGISTGNLEMYTIDDLNYCSKNECHTMMTMPRRHKHPASGANRPSDIPVTVNINAEYNLMAGNPITECF